MASESTTTQTTTWLGSTAEHSGRRSPPQYALVTSETIDHEASNSELITGVVNVLVGVIEPAAGQTTLSLYEHVNPDALEDIIKASTSKKSDIEVRFTVENYLVTVRSNNTIFIYKPLGTQCDTGGNPCPAS